MKINGEMHYLRRAVDHEGEVLGSVVTKSRDCKPATGFLKKAMRWHGRLEVIITDRLRSYGAAIKDLLARYAPISAEALAKEMIYLVQADAGVIRSNLKAISDLLTGVRPFVHLSLKLADITSTATTV